MVFFRKKETRIVESGDIGEKNNSRVKNEICSLVHCKQ